MKTAITILALFLLFGVNIVIAYVAHFLFRTIYSGDGDDPDSNTLTLWAARNKDGELYLYDGKPTINDEQGFFTYTEVLQTYSIDRDLLPNIKFENSPKKITIKILSE